MSETVIQVENLSKKYIIGHQQAGAYQYNALRDVIAEGMRSLGRRIRYPHKVITPSNQEEFWALKDVSFEVKQGEVVGIIGRNGAGKSTLLKILSRITEPTTGKIRLKGRVASLLEVGTGFHPELTGRENIFLNGAILGMSKIEINRKFDEIVEFAEISRFLDTPVKRYSSGMYVRLAFAVAAHLDPEILVIDEVLAVGDIQFQKKCLGKMEEVRAIGKTILIVSHNMASIRSLCTQALLLKNGRKDFYGLAQKAIEQYLESGGQDAQNFYKWNADTQKNEIIRFIQAKVYLDREENNRDIFDVDEDFKIAVEYEILKEIQGLRIGFLMKNHEEIIVCGFNTPLLSKKIQSSGQYLCKFNFPGNTLNSGKYLLMFGADSLPNFERLYTSDYCVSFIVEDTKGHGHLKERLPGIIKPLITAESAMMTCKTLQE
jgi:lipopolysaccharide transport system ATP-binding protein